MNDQPPKKQPPTFNPLKSGKAKPAKKKPSKKAVIPSPAKVDLSEVNPPFPVYYDSRKGHYYYEDSKGRWCGYGVKEFCRRLRGHSVSGRIEDTAQTSPQDNVIMKVHDELGIDFAGPLAGHFAGFQEINSARFLVTTSPKLPEPKAGAFPNLNEFLIGLFGVDSDPHGARQKLVFELWLARAYRGVKEHKPLLGHALILAGPRGCGKNLLQEKIIHTALGGRSEKAGAYLMGKSDFNADLFGGEHLILSDENGGRDFRSRRDFGQKIKGIVANHLHAMHPKGRDAMTVEPLWRLTISVNDEAEHLQTLPPVGDKDISDKVHLLRMWPADTPNDEDAKIEWVKQLVEEIPAFLHHCLSLATPPQMREKNPRFGHVAFQHPELLERLNSFSPELRLLELIDQLLYPLNDPFEDEWEPWLGRASDLRLKLLEAAKGSLALEREISDLIRGEALCGTYLSRIEDKFPERVKNVPRQGQKRGWQINPPPKEQEAPSVS
jgi:hypothetical protein